MGINIQKRVAKLVGRKEPDSYPTHNLKPEDDETWFLLQHGRLDPNCDLAKACKQYREKRQQASGL